MRVRIGVVAMVLVAGCATMRVYQLPLSPAEGQAMVPALIAASQAQALESFRGPNGAVTTLEDGTHLSWQNSANEQDFILLIDLPSGAPEAEHQTRFLNAKARADQLWAAAMGSRQAMLPPPVVVQPVPAVVVSQPAPTTTTTVTVPGASVSIGGDLVPNMSVSVTGPAVTTTTTQATGSASSNATCCVNGAGYTCPSAAAVDRCSGAFMRCMSACNFTCERSCRQSAPIDPSGCSRNTALDATCR